MTMARTPNTHGGVTHGGIDGLIQRLFRLFELIPYWLLALGARVAVGLYFYRSALTRVETKLDLGLFSIPLPWTIKQNQIDFLFPKEYFAEALPQWLSTVLAHLTVWAESGLPILLILGFASRFSALVLGIMTLGIGLVIYPQFFSREALHFAVLAFLIVKMGPGLVSVDAGIRRARWGKTE
jgi:putative oxidoreductase